MSSTIEQRAFRNTAVGAISFLLTLGQTVVLVPLLLEAWGPSSYGLWLALIAGVGLLQALDLGHQHYVGNDINMLYHSDPERMRLHLGSAVLVAYLVGLAELSICLVVIAGGMLTTFLGVPEAAAVEPQVALGLLCLMAAWLTVGSAGGIVTKLLIPTGLFYEAQWWGIGMRFAQFLAIVVVVFCGGGLLAACLWYAVAQVVVTLLTLRDVRRRLPQFYPWWRGAQWRFGVQGLRRSMALTLNIGGQQMANNGLVLLISSLFSSTVVPAFTTLRTLTNTGTAVTMILCTALQPDMIRFHATRESRKLGHIFEMHWFISGLCVNVGILVALPVIEPLYRLWTRNALAFDPHLFLALAAALSLANVGAALGLYLHGINDLRSQLLMTAARVVVLFGAGALLSGSYGLVGIGLACIASEGLASVALPVILVRRRLAGHAGSLGPEHLGLALIPPAALVCAVGIALAMGPNLGMITLMLLPIVSTTYYVTWRRLDPDLRSRVRSLLAALARSFTAPRGAAA